MVRMTHSGMPVPAGSILAGPHCVIVFDAAFDDDNRTGIGGTGKPLAFERCSSTKHPTDNTVESRQ